MSVAEPVRLFVRCKRCGTIFDTGRVVARGELKKDNLKGSRHACRHCAAESRYARTDYIARQVA